MANWKKASHPPSELEHRAAELLFLPTHEVLDFGPSGDERQADNVLIELPGGLLIGCDEGVVVQSRRRCVRVSVVGLGMG